MLPKGWLRAGIARLVIVLGVLSPVEFRAQYAVSGRVTDSLMQPLPLINVLLERMADSTLADHSLTDTLGRYRLAGIPAGNYRIAFRGIGWKAHAERLALSPGLRDGARKLDIRLSPQPLLLDEVTIGAGVPVQVRSDTVDIRVAAFTTGSEVVLEDVLRRLPGVQVDRSGKVYVRGRPVEKVLIEGDDIFESGYRILTRNLDAGVVSRVQVLNRYEENPVLRNIRRSDRVALNIEMKESVRESWFGRASPGGGLPSQYDSRLNGFRVARRSKFLGFASLNNVGADVLGEVYPYLHPDAFDETTHIGDGVGLQPFLNRAAAYPGIDAEHQRFNRARLAAAGVHLQPSGHWKLRSFFAIAGDQQTYRQRSVEEFRSRDLEFRNRESRSVLQESLWGLGRISTTYNKGPAHFEGLIRANWGRIHQRELIAFNALPVSWQGDEAEHLYDARLSLSRRLDSGKALVATVRHIRGRLPAFLGNPRFETGEGQAYLFPAGRTGQEFVSGMDFSGMRIGYYQSPGPLGFQSEIGWENRRSFLLPGQALAVGSDFWKEGVGSGVAGLNRNTRLYLRNGMELRLGKEFWLKPALELSHTTNHYLEGSETKFARTRVIPELRMKWEADTRNNLWLSYRYGLKETGLRQQFASGVRTGFRTVERGLGHFAQFRGHRLLMNYRFGNWGESTMLLTTLAYDRESGYPGTASRVQSEGAVSGIELMDRRELISINLEYDQYVKAFSSNLKLKISGSSRSYADRLNGKLRRVRSGAFRFGPEWRTVFPGGVNLHAGLYWQGNSYRVAETRSEAFSSHSFLDLEYRAGRRWHFRWGQERHGFGNSGDTRAVYLSDLSMRYAAPDRRIGFRIELKNLWNVRNFGQFKASDTGSYSLEAELLPRQMLLILDIRL